jgi:hypothetical protein
VDRSDFSAWTTGRRGISLEKFANILDGLGILRPVLHEIARKDGHNLHRDRGGKAP